MTTFTISHDACTIGFQNHVTLALCSPIEEQLRSRTLKFRAAYQGSAAALKNIIIRNSSLRIDFGWSFESGKHFEDMMDDCIRDVLPRYNIALPLMTTDMRCSWLGFVPYNTFESDEFNRLSLNNLILFNNDLVNFQADVVKYMSEHKMFLRTALLRCDPYRFNYFKAKRKNVIELEDAYHEYMDSIKDVCMLNGLPRDILEENIGCHFLYHPDLFFELLELSVLKGDVYE